MDRGPLNYYRWGIIKRRICVENVPGEVMQGCLSNLMDPCPYRFNTV